MKITKEFAPITIVIESVEDKDQLLSILNFAYSYQELQGRRVEGPVYWKERITLLCKDLNK